MKHGKFHMTFENKYKHMKRYLYKSLMLIAFSASIFLAGCKEDEEGQPNVAIENMDVTSAYPLEEVTIQGTNFNAVQYVFVGTIQAPFELGDGNSLTFTVPQLAVPGMSSVTLALPGSARVATEFEVLVRPVPVIQSISPSAAASGEQVTILGTSLNNIQSVMVGGVEAAVDASSTADQLIITVPDGLPANVPATISITTTGGATSSESIFYVGENLIANGELELGEGDDFTNWGKWNGADGMTATTNAAEAYAGRTLKVVSPGPNAWSSQLGSDAIPTEVGVEYTLFMWIKGEEGTPGDGGQIRFSTAPNAMYSANFDITSEWQQIQWVLTANAAETQIVIDMGAVTDAVYFIDNITLLATGQAAAQPVELIMNGGFEEGGGDDFTNWAKNNGADLLTATTNAEEVHGGSRALRAVGFGQDHWRTQFASGPMETIVGREYTASFWIKAGAGTPGEGGIVRMSTNGNGDAQYQGDNVVNSATEWQKIEWTFTANATETGLVLDLGKTLDAVYFLDDVSFLELPE